MFFTSRNNCELFNGDRNFLKPLPHRLLQSDRLEISTFTLWMVLILGRRPALEVAVQGSHLIGYFKSTLKYQCTVIS